MGVKISMLQKVEFGAKSRNFILLFVDIWQRVVSFGVVIYLYQ